MAAPFNFMVTATTTASAITSSTPVTFGVTIKADAANSGKVHVEFNSNVTTNTAGTAGFQLSAGEGIWITANGCKQDAANIYAIASGTTQGFYVMGE